MHLQRTAQSVEPSGDAVRGVMKLVESEGQKASRPSILSLGLFPPSFRCFLRVHPWLKEIFLLFVLSACARARGS